MSDGILYRDAILGVLKRQSEDGIPHISEAEIGREIGADASEAAAALHELEREGFVTRTANGNWDVTPAAASHTDARPDPKEPRQA
jgi:DNA-binding IclR family transcriptional regulator